MLCRRCSLARSRSPAFFLRCRTLSLLQISFFPAILPLCLSVRCVPCVFGEAPPVSSRGRPWLLAVFLCNLACSRFPTLVLRCPASSLWQIPLFPAILPLYLPVRFVPCVFGEAPQVLSLSRPWLLAEILLGGVLCSLARSQSPAFVLRCRTLSLLQI